MKLFSRCVSLASVCLLFWTVGCSGDGGSVQPSPSPTPASTPTEQASPTPQNGGGQATSTPSPTATPESGIVTETVVLFYADDQLMDMYRVSTEVEAASSEELPRAALERWMQGPEQEGLVSLVPEGTVIESITFNGDIAHVDFSTELRNANLGSSGELFLVDQVALIMQQFGYESTQILLGGEVVETLLGHVSTGEPVTPSSPEDYEWME